MSCRKQACLQRNVSRAEATGGTRTHRVRGGGPLYAGDRPKHLTDEGGRAARAVQPTHVVTAGGARDIGEHRASTRGRRSRERAPASAPGMSSMRTPNQGRRARIARPPPTRAALWIHPALLARQRGSSRCRRLRYDQRVVGAPRLQRMHVEGEDAPQQRIGRPARQEDTPHVQKHRAARCRTAGLLDVP
jgi:hypothetical protein